MNDLFFQTNYYFCLFRATSTKKAPSTSTTTTRRSSHSLERKPEITNDEMISYPVIKTKQQTLPKGLFLLSIKFESLYQILESKYPKAETNFIPLYGEESRTRPPPPSQTNPKPYRTEQYPPMQLPDYRSPYTNQTHKAYRERKYNNDPLPVISQNHSDRKTRPALYEPRYRVEKRYPYNTTKPTSLVTNSIFYFSHSKSLYFFRKDILLIPKTLQVYGIMVIKLKLMMMKNMIKE